MKKYILLIFVIILSVLTVLFLLFSLSLKTDNNFDSIYNITNITEYNKSSIDRRIPILNPDKVDIVVKYREVQSFFDSGKIDKYCKEFGFDNGGIEANRDYNAPAKPFCLYQNGSKTQVEYFRIDDFITWVNNEK